MTIIVALHEPGRGTWIGSDRRTVKDGIYLDCATKWRDLGDGYAVGVAGDYRIFNVIAGEAANGRMAGLKGAFDFTERVRALYEAQGWRVKADSYGAPVFGSAFILAHHSTVWGIATDLGVVDVTDSGLYAEGSGERYAFGADFVARKILSPEQRVHTAIKATCAHSPDCGGDPWVTLLPAK